MSAKNEPFNPDNEIEFFQTANGKVHVYCRRTVGTTGIALYDRLAGRLIARCGARSAPAAREWVEVFPDSDLCPKCYNAVPSEHRWMLFCHEKQ